MAHILKFHTEIGKMPVVLDPCSWPWPRLTCPWLVYPWPWPRKNFKVLGLDLKGLAYYNTGSKFRSKVAVPSNGFTFSEKLLLFFSNFVDLLFLYIDIGGR